MLNLSGLVVTLAGSSLVGFSDSSPFSFNQPMGVVLSSDQSVLYVSDNYNFAIRAVTLWNPTAAPTAAPSVAATTAPSTAPTRSPTAPTATPSSNPTSPTARPSACPTVAPSMIPSAAPSASPTPAPVTAVSAGKSRSCWSIVYLTLLS